ncbi:hypothetical protein ILFOPFJJ_06152 [Ensifer psoraleae]|uniref:hypothetical protein n=1 Tax=Sinorhizobium TaxID=28105 RepID=UPI001569E3F8|nr:MULTISPECIES: hypothetical protein [Sinorhizobium]MDK1389756.1 hypothetical protein [Sinorhizobium sp. 7-81]NRP75229.1 hypothetical protein [Sinorhizobium psoraleae]
MTRQEIIEQLGVLKEPNRHLDLQIAVLFKYRREKNTIPADGDKPARIQAIWYDPNGKMVGIVPRFTESIDAAKSLFDYALPKAAGGFSFHSGYAQATVNGGEAVTAFNEATALCLATMKAVPSLESSVETEKEQ